MDKYTRSFRLFGTQTYDSMEFVLGGVWLPHSVTEPSIVALLTAKALGAGLRGLYIIKTITGEQFYKVFTFASPEYTFWTYCVNRGNIFPEQWCSLFCNFSTIRWFVWIEVSTWCTRIMMIDMTNIHYKHKIPQTEYPISEIMSDNVLLLRTMKCSMIFDKNLATKIK